MKNERTENDFFPEAGGGNGISPEEKKRRDIIAALQKEVNESVRGALSAPKGEEQDIEPVAGFVCGEAEKNGLIPNRGGKEKALADFDKQRFFWGLVGESLSRERVFVSLFGKLAQSVADGRYGEAEMIINVSMRDLINKLRPTIHKTPDELGMAISELKNKFYEFYPEVRALIYGAAEGKRTKIKTPKGETAKEYEKKHGLSEGGEGGAAKKEDKEPRHEHPRLLKEKTWDVPSLKELRPGLIVVLENIETGKKATVELVGMPYRDALGDLAADVVLDINGKSKSASAPLAPFGLAEYLGGGWDGWWRPIRWDMKSEESLTPENSNRFAAAEKESRVSPISPDELRPGVMIELENVETGKKKTVEIMSDVYEDKKGEVVCYAKSTREDTGLLTYEALNLKEIGILSAYPPSYLDNAQKAHWRPIRKYMNTEGENK